jgi:S-(hydroxymethyl)glutathione dehydrogenase/alcohol dehydrogenase
MRCNGAVVHEVGGKWTVEEIEVDPPKAGEVIVQWKVAGLCHSDEHVVTGDMVPTPEAQQLAGIEYTFPLLGGHEGAGIVVDVGAGVTSVKPGDHVSSSFMPSCGTCRYCSTGRQALCDNGRGTFVHGMITDGTSRHRLGGDDLLLFAKLGTFAQYTCVAESSVIKVHDYLPLEVVALVSCGVATGWGSATKRADVRPGETVVVVGVGGVGINAVQGARMAGARHVIAIDPLEFKREKAIEFGATHTFASMAESLPAITELTWGRLAEKLIMAPGVLYGDLLDEAMELVGKDGTVVITGIAPLNQRTVSLNMFKLAMWNKEIKGTLFGSLNPRSDIPRLLDLYSDGQLKLDELITNRYPLDAIEDGYQAMRDGTNIRGIVVHD